MRGPRKSRSGRGSSYPFRVWLGEELKIESEVMRKIVLYDTTLRDGAQTEGISLSLDDKLKIAMRLDAFGIPIIEGGWPGSNPKDLGFFKEIRKRPVKQAKIAAFGATRRAHTRVSQDANIQALLQAKTQVVTIFGKTSDLHVVEVFRTSLKENLSMIRDSVAYLKSKNLEVIYDAEHFFDAFRSNPEYAVETVEEAVRSGADVICLCDTNGGSLPEEIAEGVEQIRRRFSISLGIHCHNDMNLATANSIVAVQKGCEQVQGTINGYGERCGNTDLTSILPILELRLGYRCLGSARAEELTRLSHYVAEVCNMPVEHNQPFVGPSAFAHKGGVHIDAVVKNAKTYEHIDPAKIGNQRKFLVSELSGKANILVKAKEMDLHLSQGGRQTRAILTKIRELENQGYQFEAAEASFQLLMKKMTGKYKKFFDLLGFKVIDVKHEDGKIVSEATVMLKVNGVQEHTAAAGDGPVNALDNALRKALLKFYPVIERIHLTDYKVRVINGEQGTAARVRVFIQFQDESSSWQTVGVSENIIEASWEALVSAIEYKLLQG